MKLVRQGLLQQELDTYDALAEVAALAVQLLKPVAVQGVAGLVLQQREPNSIRSPAGHQQTTQ